MAGYESTRHSGRGGLRCAAAAIVARYSHLRVRHGELRSLEALQRSIHAQGWCFGQATHEAWGIAMRRDFAAFCALGH